LFSGQNRTHTCIVWAERRIFNTEHGSAKSRAWAFKIFHSRDWMHGYIMRH